MKFPQDYLKLINVTSSCYGYWRYIGKPSLTDWSLDWSPESKHQYVDGFP